VAATPGWWRAEKLAKEKSVGLPAGYARDFKICRRFLDDQVQR
jgi:hypothetical protein